MSDTENDAEDLPADTSGYPTETETERGDDEEEQETVLEEEPIVYNSEDFISGPFVSEHCTIPDNILEFEHSFGYDCKRHYNLVAADDNTLIFASGNLIHFYDVETQKLWFRRSSLGGGIGHIAKNPNSEYRHIAVAENGKEPPIIIYEWPSLDIVCLLKEGAAARYAHLHYSPDGELLVSQSGPPDDLITVWNWPKARILLRTRSHVDDVHRVMFSPYCPGHLTSCGRAHIKFWRMAQTFTGLKLKGELGRFGKTEYCDILGIYPMADEKVISGCSWGNILIWEAGLIKLEVKRKLGHTCHSAPIIQFDFKDGELYTVGMDGHIKTWFYDTIELADPPDEDRVLEMEFIFDYHTPDVEFMCVIKRYTDPLDTYYFAQDGNGGISLIHLDSFARRQPGTQLLKSHAGAVADIAVCPWGQFLASLGVDGRLYLYNYVERKLIFSHQFPAKGAKLIWLPLDVQSTGDEIVMAFDDGNIRTVVIKMTDAGKDIELILLQVTKPHNKPITAMTINKCGSLLITGAKDATIFIYKVQSQIRNYTYLIPIGFIPVPGEVTCFTWLPNNEATVIAGCIFGQIVQVEVPKIPQEYTTISYLLKLNPKHQQFITYKAQIRRDLKIKEIEAKKAVKVARKRVEMEKVKKDNPGLEIDAELFLADSETEEELEPLHIPDVPNKILWIQYTEDDTLWLSMGGYDAGYIYEYCIDQKEPIPYRFLMVHDGDDTEISSFVYNYDKTYLICAMQNGSLRVNKVNPTHWRDLSDYWQLSMHDNNNGFVPKMCFSYDEKYFFSCGHDGNIFSYHYNPEHNNYFDDIQARNKLDLELSAVDDVSDYTVLSLEETKQKAEYDRKHKLVNEHKAGLLNKLADLRTRFVDLLKRNLKLLPTQVIAREQLEIDPRITESLKDKLESEQALVKRKLAFQVEKSEVGMRKLMKHFVEPLDLFPICVTGVQKQINIKTLRQRKLGPEFYNMHKIVNQKIIEDELKGRPPERPPVVVEAPPPPEKKEKQLEFFLVGLSPSTIQCKMGAKLTRLLNKYRMRKIKAEKRQEEWDCFKAMKPEEGVNHPEDEIAFAQAQDSIGDYKLKSAPDYKVPRHLRESTVKKYKQLLNLRERQYNIRHEFNQKVYDLRVQKVELHNNLTQMCTQLQEIHQEIPEHTHNLGPAIPHIQASDFPEKKLEIVVILPASKQNKLLMHHVPSSVEILTTIDHMEKEVLVHKNREHLGGDMERILTSLCTNNSIKTVTEANFDVLLKYSKNESTDTPWETEMLSYRLVRKLHEQNKIIKKMEDEIKIFNEAIEDKSRERLQVIVDANFTDLHLLTLNQELIILRDFEAGEDELAEIVHEKMIELLDLKDLVTETNNKIDTHQREILRLNEREKAIQQQFTTSVIDNKFYDFLRRIFKKKYRPPKIRDADDSESESESSSSSEESDEADAGSIDSRDIGPIRLDESVCPKGCDQTLYDNTFAFRSQRHGVELERADRNKSIELLKKELEGIIKKVRVVESNLKVRQENLEKFQREKQSKLNQVICVTVLKLNQLQHLLSESKSNKISDILIFSKTVLSKLYKRVGQLHSEMLQQKAKHKVNITHLCRMSTDCKHMELKIAQIKAEILELMKIKFGKTIDIDEIEEALLKRLVYTLRMSMIDIRSLYDYELRLWKNRHGNKQSELANTIKDNTARLELLAAMNKEKAELAKLIEHQGRRKEHLDNVVDVAAAYKDDIKKLSDIVKNQRKELQALKDEIKKLTTKGMLLRGEENAVKPFEKGGQQVEEEIDDEYDWEDYEAYMLKHKEDYYRLEESEEDLKPFITEVQIPPVIAEESEEIARTIIIDMIESMQPSVDKTTIESIVDQILSDVSRRTSAMEIIQDILSILPVEPNDEQQIIIELTAERLYSGHEKQMLQETDSRTLLQEILDHVSPEVEPYELMAEIISNVTDKLPLETALQQESVSLIANKLSQHLSQSDMDKEQLVGIISSYAGSHTEESKILVEQIINYMLDNLNDLFATLD